MKKTATSYDKVKCIELCITVYRKEDNMFIEKRIIRLKNRSLQSKEYIHKTENGQYQGLSLISDPISVKLNDLRFCFINYKYKRHCHTMYT